MTLLYQDWGSADIQAVAHLERAVYAAAGLLLGLALWGLIRIVFWWRRKKVEG